GPIVGGAVNPYIERRQRLRADPSFEVPFLHPSLEPPLRDTLGTIIFQDQVLEVAQAFAGFSVGEAEGLRRAMSRKRSAEAIEAHHRRFVEGAMATHPDVTEKLAEEVFTMVSGFSGFGFPKAHGAAFGLLAYQSTWLRVHYGPEFLCALLDEQPMGFYPPDALVHEAQRRGIEVLAPDVNTSDVGCTVTGSHPSGAVQVGLGYVLGVRADEVAALVAARQEGGPFRSLEDLASRAGAGRAALEKLAWSGACDKLAGGDRRVALWQLGVTAPGVKVRGEGTQLALALDLPAPPKLAPLSAWDGMVADYATAGLTASTHPIGLLRARLHAGGATDVAALEGLRHGDRVRVGGLVIARQRPGTAKGITFLLLEDEFGTVNVIVSPDLYERERLTVRTEPLVVVEGRLERHASAGGAINIVARRFERLEAGDRVAAQVKDFSVLDAIELARQAEMQRAAQELAATGTDNFRAVAPPVMNFGAGRRR
ncbi:MAG TPA: OB-fold nucleic acid binding domain-containing protein, partial [Solirubrobacteraceae bacterium]|nr:OB-fold nucleic acid binding domain-containing protein [Solirubrobacteraceae bacterium]